MCGSLLRWQVHRKKRVRGVCRSCPGVAVGIEHAPEKAQCGLESTLCNVGPVQLAHVAERGLAVVGQPRDECSDGCWCGGRARRLEEDACEVPVKAIAKAEGGRASLAD